MWGIGGEAFIVIENNHALKTIYLFAKFLLTNITAFYGTFVILEFFDRDWNVVGFLYNYLTLIISFLILHNN